MRGMYDHIGSSVFFYAFKDDEEGNIKDIIVMLARII